MNGKATYTTDGNYMTAQHIRPDFAILINESVKKWFPKPESVGSPISQIPNGPLHSPPNVELSRPL